MNVFTNNFKTAYVDHELSLNGGRIIQEAKCPVAGVKLP